MDTLTFRIEKRENSLQAIVAIPYVNGISLIDILKLFEARFDKSIAGSYDGIRPDVLKKELRDGSPFDSTKSRILECECGADGCWPLLLTAKQTNDTVVWSMFAQYNRDEWDYEDLSFVFEINSYLDAINSLEYKYK